MSAKRMAKVYEALEEDTKISKRFLSVQVRIWRSLSVIHAHHPELAKSSMLNMALNATIVGSIESLELIERNITEQARKCGITIGVFASDPSIELCNKVPNLWSLDDIQSREEEKTEAEESA